MSRSDVMTPREARSVLVRALLLVNGSAEREPLLCEQVAARLEFVAAWLRASAASRADEAVHVVGACE